MEIANKMIGWKEVMNPILAYMLVINLIAFILYGIDKNKAKKKKWRIPEKTLIGVGAIGGSVGALLGMYVFRHKTKHWHFRILLPIFLVLQVLIIAGVWYKIK